LRTDTIPTFYDIMSSILRRLSNLFHYVVDGNAEPKRLLVLGLDAAGKTTFLYKLRSLGPRLLGQAEVVTTIPTIGFNVETIETRDHSMTCWDIGGCDKIRPLWRHYMQNIGGILFFIDSNDRDRVDDAKTELYMFLKEVELVGVPLLVVRNKCDLPNSAPSAEIVERLELNSIRGREWNIISGCMTTGDGIPAIMDWIRASSVRSGVAADEDTSGLSLSLPAEALSITAQPVGPTAEESMIAKAKADADRQQRVMAATEWVERVDCPEDEFLALLESYQLDVWDHYTHVRIAWVLITKHGIRDGFNKVAEAIQGYIANSTRTDGKSYHATMTRFWCHMIAYCMHLASYQARDASALTFKTFIAAVCRESSQVGAVALWDKTLFKRYYTPALMFSPRARGEVVAPDLLALPDIVPVLNSAVLGGKSVVADIAILEESAYWQLGGEK
jgi:small GTP-binding protein